MSFSLVVPTLIGSRVRVEPLSLAHVEDLTIAGTEDRTTYEFTWVPNGREETNAYVRTQLARYEASELVPFAQVRIADGRAVGSTCYFSFRYLEGAISPFALEIGYTWLASSAQRTGINVETKLLLLKHAFEEWGLERVDLKTDERNIRSRQAIVGIGATFEGVLRRFSPSWAPGESGMLRDSAMFSIVASEWPTIESRLRERLHKVSGGV